MFHFKGRCSFVSILNQFCIVAEPMKQLKTTLTHRHTVLRLRSPVAEARFSAEAEIKAPVDCVLIWRGGSSIWRGGSSSRVAPAVGRTQFLAISEMKSVFLRLLVWGHSQCLEATVRQMVPLSSHALNH